MKKAILSISIILIMLSACDSGYITVKDVKDGQYIVVKDQHHLTKMNDTLVIYKNKMARGYYLYGKCVNPNAMPVDSLKTFNRVVRIK